MIDRLLKNEFVRHGAMVFAGVVLANVLNYLYYMLVGRAGGVEIYGVVTSLTSVLLVVSAPAIVGQLIVARLAGELQARGDIAALLRLGDIATWWTGGAAFVFASIAFALRAQLATFFNLTTSTPIVIAAVSFVFMTVVFAQRGVFQGSQRFGDLSTSLAIDSSLKVAVGVPLVGALGSSGALLGVLASQVVAAGYALGAFRVRFGTVRAALALDRALIVRVVSHVGLGQLTFTVLMFYDVPLIKHAFDARSAGLYAAAALVGRAVIAAIAFVPTLVMPKATARAAEGASPLPLLGAALGIAGIIVAVALVAVLAAPQFVVTLIAGRAFGAAAPLVLPYVAASSALSLANVIAAYKMGLHQYNFVIPALVTATAEVAAFSLWHPTLLAAIVVLLIGHVAILCSTLVQLNEGLRRSGDD